MLPEWSTRMNGELWPLNRLGKNGKTRTKAQFHGPQMGTGEDVDRESSSLLQGTCLLNSKHFAKDPDVKGLAETIPLAQHVLLLEAPGLMISSSLDLLQLWRLRSVQRQMRCLLDLRLTLEPGRTPDLRMNRETMTFEKIVKIFQAMLLHPPLLRAPDCAGRTPLLRAAQLGLPQLCAALLAAKAEVNGRGGNGWTALHYAATGRCVETCRVLLDHGAQVEARSLDGCTPFYYAYRAGDEVELMQLLHARGARPDLRAQNAAGTADWGYLRYGETRNCCG